MADLEKLMKKAFRLAEKGLGYTSPNPAVGAVIFKDGQVIATGYHRKAGLPHAEIEALKIAGDNARGSTLVVTLEPCSHFGKTPPCVDAIINSGIKEVVCATADPNSLVDGSGIKKLRMAGIDVTENVMADMAADFYAPYFKFITSKLPFVTLKYAQSIDGRIATKTGHSQWISSPESLVFSHKLRAVNDAILVGNGTLKKDNPQLTTRLVKGSNPVRIILSQSGKVNHKSTLFHDGQAPVYIAGPDFKKRNNADGFDVIAVRKGKTGLNLGDLLRKLGKMNIMTLLVEGGPKVLTSFLRQHQADKIMICIAPLLIGDGINAIGDLNTKVLGQAIQLDNVNLTKSGPDFIISGKPVWS